MDGVIFPQTSAMEAAMEAVAVCEKAGYRVTATVMDASGLVKAIAKGDLAPPHTLDSSRGKSYAAVSLGPNFSEPTTSAIVARIQGTHLGRSPGRKSTAAHAAISTADTVNATTCKVT